MLKILVLGPPAVLLNDEPITIRRRQLRSMLYLLACKPDGISRGELITLFWPESSEIDARRQLRELLSKLRSQVPDRNILQTSQDHIRLDHDNVYSDARHFLSLIAPIRQYQENNHPKEVLPENLVEMLERAVALWRTPTFLSGARISNTTEFDYWLRETSSKFELYRLQIHEWLGGHFTAKGELAKAIYNIQKALDADPLNDVLQSQLLSLLYNAGRVAEAQTYYRYLMDLYQREYENEMPQNLQIAFNEVSHISAGTSISKADAPSKKEPSGRYFLGRTKELELLHSAYEKGGMAFINGELGVGKSRLVHEFCTTLDQHPRVMNIHCQAQDENLPLQPMISMLRQFTKRDDWESLDNQWLKSLSILIPDVIHQADSFTTLDEWPSNEARMEIFESIYQLLVSYSRNAHLVLVIDDAQWIDIDTMQALMYLSTRKLFDKNGFLILISRMEIRNTKARQILFKDKNHGFINRITLKPFALSETGHFARLLLEQDLPQELIRKIQLATGGNPFFIKETIQFLTNRYGRDRAPFLEDIPLAENLHEIIKEKTINLSKVAREILFAGAVCGMEFQYDVLEYLQLCKPDILVQNLEELESQNIIHATKSVGSSGQYTFNHSLIRDSILKQISPARECYLHEKIAATLIALRGPQINRFSGTVARHYELAGKPVSAFSYWIKAGLYARGLFSLNEAFGAFLKANVIQKTHAHAIQESDLYALFLEWGNFAYSVMDCRELDACYASMYDTGCEINSPLLTGAGLSGLGLSAFYKLEFEKSLVLLVQSQSIIDKTNNLFEKIQVRSYFGFLYMTTGLNNKAVEVFLEAISLGQGVSNQLVRKAVSHAQCQLSMLQTLMGCPLDAIDTVKAAQRNAYLLVTKPTSQSYTHVVLATAEFYCGDFTNALKDIRNSTRIVENFQNKRVLALSQCIEARIDCIQGRLDTAWNLALKTLEIATEKKLFEYISESHCVMGDIYLTLHSYDDAIREYKIAWENLEGTHPGINALYRLGYALVKNGEVEEGLNILEEAIDSATRLGFNVIRLSAQYLRGIVLKENGDIEAANRIFKAVVTESDAQGLSLLTYIGSYPQMQYLWDHMENALAEQVLDNLIQVKAISPGKWIDCLIDSFYRHHMHTEKFDIDRLKNHLQSLKEN